MPLSRADGTAVFQQYDGRKDQGDDIAEKRLLHHGHVPRHADEQIHQGEKEGRNDDVDDPQIFGINFYMQHNILYLYSAAGAKGAPHGRRTAGKFLIL